MKKIMNKKIIYLFISLSFLLVFVNYISETRTDSKKTIVKDIEMRHIVIQERKGFINLEMELSNLKYGVDDESDLINKKEEVIISDGLGKELSFLEVVSSPFDTGVEYKLPAVNSKEVDEWKGFRVSTITEAVSYFFNNVQGGIEKISKKNRQPIIVIRKQLELKEKNSKEQYEGPIKIEMNNSAFSKVFIGEVKDGLIQINEEKLIINKK